MKRRSPLQAEKPAPRRTGRTPMPAAATKRSKLGFIGLGDIGLPMASNLLKGGFDVSVCDLRPAAVKAAVKLGARAAASVKALAASCDYISIAVVNEAQMDLVVSGPDGLFANARPGTAILSHSTMPPAVAEHFAGRAEALGLAWLDVPMSGASVAAKAGTLTFLVGGDARLLDRCRPILKAMGTNIFHIGPMGTGQVAKLVNGLLLHVGYVAILEALNLASAYRVPEAQIIALASVSTGNSWSVKYWGHMDDLVEKHIQGPEAVIQTHMRKDILDALIAAKAADTSMPMTGIAMEIYPDLVRERLRRLGKRIRS